MTVEPVAEQVEQGYHGHVEDEKSQQASSAEVSEEGIHPDPHRQIHPHDPREQARERGGRSVIKSLLVLFCDLCTFLMKNIVDSYANMYWHITLFPHVAKKKKGIDNKSNLHRAYVWFWLKTKEDVLFFYDYLNYQRVFRRSI